VAEGDAQPLVSGFRRFLGESSRKAESKLTELVELEPKSDDHPPTPPAPFAQLTRTSGTAGRRVTPGRFLTPVWSPDSTKLLLNSRDRNDQTSLWTVKTDGSGLSKLTDTTGLAHYAWGSAPAE
jgi:hypothetical protein